MTEIKKQNRAGVLIFKDQKILVFHRIKQAGPVAEFYAIPGGSIEEDETAQQAAVRELQEELGLEIDLGPLFLHCVNDKRDEYYFLADTWSGVPVLGGPELAMHCSTNQYNVKWLTVEQLKVANLYPEKLKDVLIVYMQLQE